MTLRQYFPISVAVFVAVVATILYVGIPVWPFVIILLVGETLLGFELEDHQVPRLLKYILTVPKPRH